MIFLNALRAARLRTFTPWTGVWVADVDVDLADVPIMPSGRCALTVGLSAPMLGTIDEDHAGRFGASGRARVIAGGAGWGKSVAERQFHSDGIGVLNTIVIAATAAEVEEIAAPAIPPKRLGIDYFRLAGPASDVLEGLPWYVTPQGVTVVGPRTPLPPSPNLEIISWDPATSRAEIASDELVLPGTVLADVRFGTAQIRDVEQTWDEDGARAVAWCKTGVPSVELEGGPLAGGPLANAIRGLARDPSAPFRAGYRYRVLQQLPDGRFILQVEDRDLGIPSSIAISLFPAVPGMTVKVTPGAIVRLSFLDGDRTKPVVDAFEESALPVLEVTIGTLRFAVGEGLFPALLLTPDLITWLGSVGTTTAVGPPPLAAATAKKLFGE